MPAQLLPPSRPVNGRGRLWRGPDASGGGILTKKKGAPSLFLLRPNTLKAPFPRALRGGLARGGILAPFPLGAPVLNSAHAFTTGSPCP